jgi:hypothetical protein
MPLLALALLATAPASPASAQCPGCDEYTLDIPSQTGDKSVDPTQEESSAPEPAPAPAPEPAPTATVPAAPETTDPAPAPIEPQAPGIRERRGPRLPVTLRTIEPRAPVVESAQRPVTSVAAEEPGGGSPLPLYAVMGAIALAGAGLGISRRLSRRAKPALAAR